MGKSADSVQPMMTDQDADLESSKMSVGDECSIRGNSGDLDAALDADLHDDESDMTLLEDESDITGAFSSDSEQPMMTDQDADLESYKMLTGDERDMTGVFSSDSGDLDVALDEDVFGDEDDMISICSSETHTDPTHITDQTFCLYCLKSMNEHNLCMHLLSNRDYYSGKKKTCSKSTAQERHTS